MTTPPLSRDLGSVDYLLVKKTKELCGLAKQLSLPNLDGTKVRRLRRDISHSYSDLIGPLGAIVEERAQKNTGYRPPMPTSSALIFLIENVENFPSGSRRNRQRLRGIFDTMMRDEDVDANVKSVLVNKNLAGL